MSSDQPRAPQHDIDAAGDVDTVQAVSVGGGHVRDLAPPGRRAGRPRAARRR